MLSQMSGQWFDAFYANITVGLVQTLGSILGAVLMAKVQRRPMVLVSSVLCSIIMAVMGVLFYFKEAQASWIQEKEINIGIMVCLMGFTLSYTSGLGPVPWVLMGELLSGDS